MAVRRKHYKVTFYFTIWVDNVKYYGKETMFETGYYAKEATDKAWTDLRILAFDVGRLDYRRSHEVEMIGNV